MSLKVVVEVTRGDVVNVRRIEEDFIVVRPYGGKVVVRYFGINCVPYGFFNFMRC